MGQSLVEHSPRAQALFAEADATIGWDLSSVCFNGPEEELTETRVCQPALYVHGFTVFTLLSEAGKLPAPAAFAGLSLGELTACAAAGVFDFTDGLKIVAERGRLMQLACEATEGTMASLIGGERADVEALAAEHDVDVGNYNCPGQIVLSGEGAKIEAAVAAAKASGQFKRAMPLKVAGAYHSRLMQPARDAFAAFLADIPFRAPSKPVFSNATGQAQTDPQAIKDALIAQVTSAVRWEDNTRAMAAMGLSDFAECGVGNVLAGLAKRTDRAWNVTSYGEWDSLGLS